MTRYASSRELAHALQDTAADRPGLLFYNEHRPDTTPVWLLPDPYEKPAHHRAKFGVWPWGDGGDQVFVQWCVEKGVEGAAAASFPASDRLDDRWAWPRVMAAAMDRSFDARLKRAEETAGRPLTVQLRLGTAVPGRGRDYAGTRFQQLVWERRGGQLVLQSETDEQGGFDARLGQATSVRMMALVLAQMAELDWCWIDFGVGMVLPLRADTLAPEDIWTRVLNPWRDAP